MCVCCCYFFCSFIFLFVERNDSVSHWILMNLGKCLSKKKETRYYFQVKEFSIIGKVFNLIVASVAVVFRLNVRACSNHHNTFLKLKCTCTYRHVTMPSTLSSSSSHHHHHFIRCDFSKFFTHLAMPVCFLLKIYNCRMETNFNCLAKAIRKEMCTNF